MGRPMMRAFQKMSATAGDARLMQVPIPAVARKEALVRVVACGVCGSDLHTIRTDPGYEWIATPRVIGHECAGVVVEVGGDCNEVSVGDEVVPLSIQGCGVCRVCHARGSHLCPTRQILGLHYDGALADYVVIPERQLVPIPRGLDLQRAALTEPLTVAVHAILGRSQIRPGVRVAVSGPGTIGLLCAQLARAAGGDVVVLGATRDRLQRLRVASELGFPTGDIEEERAADVVRHHFGQHQPDAWVEASGATAALDAAIECCAPGAQITVVAMFADRFPLAVPSLLRREISLVTTYAANRSDYFVALDLLAGGQVATEPLVDCFPLGRVEAALAAAEASVVTKPLVLPESRAAA